MSQNLKRALLHVDLFAHEPENDEKPRKIRSLSGSFCSLVIVLAYVGYSIYQIEQFISNPSATSTPQITEVDITTSIPLPTIAMAAPGPGFVDAIPNMVIVGSIFLGDDQSQSFSFQVCTLEDVPPSLKNAVTYCPSIQNLTVPGTYENSIVNNMSLTVTIFPNNCNYFSQNMAQLLFVAVLNPFEVNYTTGEFDQVYNYNIVKTSISGNLMLSSILPLEIEEYDISPDYLKRWQTHSQTKYYPQPLQTDYTITGSCNTNAPLISLQFVVAPTMTTTSVTYATILDLFSSLGALWTTAFGVIALVFVLCYKHEQKKLMKRMAAKSKAEVHPEQPPERHSSIRSNQSGIELKTPESVQLQKSQDKLRFTSDKEQAIDI